MAVNLAALFALSLTVLALIPSGAHLFALPNKIDLAQEAYFVVQSIYRGWALFGFIVVPAVLMDAVLAFLYRDEALSARLAGAAAVLLAATLLVFFLWIFPANQATSNWTAVPPNWQELRRNWEYGHAVNAILVFGAFLSLTGAILSRPG